jgi:hypothetical protein
VTFWQSLGASEGQVTELLHYARSDFDYSHLPGAYPLGDEPFAEAWQSYVETSRQVGVLPCLQQRLVQLQFPIASGISETLAYRMATRQGAMLGHTEPRRMLELIRPSGLRLFLHQTPAGRVPVIVTEAREDFVALVRALTRRNEPDVIPSSIGACIVSGYNNWDRIAELRRRWQATPSGEGRAPSWEERFRELVADPSLYQDRFVILSTGPYSAVAATDLGRDTEQWEHESLQIRLAHECTHYFTRKVLGTMRNVLTDELVADYMGIVAGHGRFRADWFLRFMGLDVEEGCRPAGRLQSYRGDPPLSDGAFSILQTAVRRAAHNLELFFERLRPTASSDDADKAQTIIALTRMGLEGMARDGLATTAATPVGERRALALA